MVLLVFAACGGDPVPTEPGPATLSIALTPSTGTVVQGGSLTVSGTATVGGSFTGDVTFTVTGLPAGVTWTVGSPTTAGSTVTVDITVNVAASVAPGTYAGTITAEGSGVSASTAYSLTVTAAPTGGFTLGSVADASVQQGGSTTRTVDIARTGGFTGDVTITVEGVPSGVTATPAPATTSGASSTITIDVSGSAATGTSTLTVRGTATGRPDATTTFGLTITAPPAIRELAFDYSMCDFTEMPVWVAVQDGPSGAWTRVTGSADVYGFTVTAATFGIATVVDAPGATDLSVSYFGEAQIEDDLIDVCPPPPSKIVSGTAAGTVGLTSISLGGSGTVLFTSGPFQLAGVPDGEQDLVGFSIASGGTAGRMLIQRDLDIPGGGSVGTVDFATGGFDAASATITLSGLGAGASGFAGMDYASSSAGSMCAVSSLHSGIAGASFTALGAPPTERASDEYHVASVTVTDGDHTKVLRESFGALGDRTVVMPADLPMPTMTDATGGAGYLRLQAEYDLPAEYDGLTFFGYSVDTWNMVLFATGDAFSTDVSLTMPDFSGVDGWDDMWAIPAASTGVGYAVSATGITDLAGLCVDGGRTVTSARTGMYN